jgi:hypothetical protein
MSYARDEAFEMFIEEFGEAFHRRDVPEDVIERFRGRLPDRLLGYWQNEGWCGYADGRFWTVNPEDYEDLLDFWLEGSGLEHFDRFHVVARTAFGKLFVWGERSGQCIDISPAVRSILALPRDLRRRTPRELDLDAIDLFAGAALKDGDFASDAEGYLFEPALRTLGRLEPDEMYGFEPALVAGGTAVLANLRRVKLHPHLLILRQLAQPTLPFSGGQVDQLLKQQGF